MNISLINISFAIDFNCVAQWLLDQQYLAGLENSMCDRLMELMYYILWF